MKALVNMVMNCNTAALAEGLGLGAALEWISRCCGGVQPNRRRLTRLETDGEDMQA